jgi:hypothetical protein
MPQQASAGFPRLGRPWTIRSRVSTAAAGRAPQYRAVRLSGRAEQNAEWQQDYNETGPHGSRGEHSLSTVRGPVAVKPERKHDIPRCPESGSGSDAAG